MKKNERLISPSVIQSKGAVRHPNSIHSAYCKTNAPADTKITCYLDIDATGTEIDVYCSIAGGGNLDTAWPHFTDGLEIPVRYDAAESKWKYVGNLQNGGAC